MKIGTHTSSPAQSLPELSPNPPPHLADRTGARPRRVSGFTLVETVVATFLAAIMLSAVYGGMGAGFSMVKVTRENLRATQILLQRMEAIRLSPYQALQNPATYPTNSTDYYCPGQTNGGAGVAYSVTYNCAPGPSSLPPSYRSNVV